MREVRVILASSACLACVGSYQNRSFWTHAPAGPHPSPLPAGEGVKPGGQRYAAPMCGTSPAVGWPFLRAAVKASMRSIGKRARRPSAGSMWTSFAPVSSTWATPASPFIAIQGQCAQLLQVVLAPAVGASTNVLPGLSGLAQMLQRLRSGRPCGVLQNAAQFFFSLYLPPPHDVQNPAQIENPPRLRDPLRVELRRPGVDEKEIAGFSPKLVFVDADNRIGEERSSIAVQRA